MRGGAKRAPSADEIVRKGAMLFPDLWPWDMGKDAAIRNADAVDPARYGNSSRENLAELLELNSEVGHEGSDYQNPYAFASTGVLDYPSPFGTQLAPGSYGLGDSGQAETDVVTNIRATSGIIVRG